MTASILLFIPIFLYLNPFNGNSLSLITRTYILLNNKMQGFNFIFLNLLNPGLSADTIAPK